jgi:hypothetical protein
MYKPSLLSNDPKLNFPSVVAKEPSTIILQNVAFIRNNLIRLNTKVFQNYLGVHEVLFMYICV